MLPPCSDHQLRKNFYAKLSECIVNAKGDNLIVLGDFNARVGKDGQSWPSVIGKYEVGKMNSNSLMLLEFGTRFQLSAMGTDVPTQESTQEHLITYAIKTLAPNRPCAS